MRILITGAGAMVGAALAAHCRARGETWDSGLRKTIEWYRENTAWIDHVRSGAYREYYARQYGMEASAR